MSEEKDRKTTQVEEGWRSEDSKTDTNATKVEDGWRQESSDDSNKTTQVDNGWRNSDKSRNKATEVDPGWRDPNKSEGKATEVDSGWRDPEKSERIVTEVDPGWRNKINDTLDPQKLMYSVTANFFSKIDDFKDAVEKLLELKSASGYSYHVKNTISRKGGESIVLLCSAPDDNEVVAKVYYEPVNGAGSSISSRARVLEYMQTDEGKRYTLAVADIGLVDFGGSKYYFEIMPYCPDTDLSDDAQYSFEQIVEITKQLNEALHSIHQAGIIHRDIKPENIFKFGDIYKIGDFGIAKEGAQGRYNITEHIVGTEGYRAPEATRYLFSSASDYYSLGITLASLFEGHFIFENMTYEMQTLAQEGERLPLTRVDPNREMLENLLNGLCRISRKQRFNYDDVNKWLEDHNYGRILEEGWPRDLELLEGKYRDEKSLFYGITKDKFHWDAALLMLYNKTFGNFFSTFKTNLANIAHQIADEDEYRNNNIDKGLFIFLKALYAPGPIVWKGVTFNSTEELGDKMIATETSTDYVELLQNNCISIWLEITKGVEVPDETKELVNSIEKISLTKPEVACYWFGRSFASAKQLEKCKLKICNKEVTTIDELIKVLFSSSKIFYQTDGYKKLKDQKDGADLYGYLFSLGYKEIVDKEWEKLKDCDLFNKTVILIDMLDVIAVKAGANVTTLKILRNFFTHYGPVGIAALTKQLVEEKVYTPLDYDGKTILDEISSFDPPAEGTVVALFRAYLPLIEKVDKMRNQLIDNPHLIELGFYEEKGVRCTNLKGCFAFKIFDRVAPLAFNTLIENN